METNAPLPRRYGEMPPVRTQADLERHWRGLMGPLGFSETLLWVVFFDTGGCCTPYIQQIAELSDEPEECDFVDLIAFCAQIIDDVLPGGSVAFLRSRPGSAAWTLADRAWASGLTRAAQRSPVRVHPVHLANDHDLRVFAPDDVAACLSTRGDGEPLPRLRGD